MTSAVVRPRLWSHGNRRRRFHSSATEIDNVTLLHKPQFTDLASLDLYLGHASPGDAGSLLRLNYMPSQRNVVMSRFPYRIDLDAARKIQAFHQSAPTHAAAAVIDGSIRATIVLAPRAVGAVLAAVNVARTGHPTGRPGSYRRFSHQIAGLRYHITVDARRPAVDGVRLRFSGMVRHDSLDGVDLWKSVPAAEGSVADMAREWLDSTADPAPRLVARGLDSLCVDRAEDLEALATFFAAASDRLSMTE